MTQPRTRNLSIVLWILLITVAIPSLAQNGEIHSVEGDVQPPKAIERAAPAYPPAAQKEGIEGQVIVKTVIDQEGHVGEVEVVSSPGPDFDDAVRQALTVWKFEPARLDDQPVAVYYRLTFNFRLDGDKKEEGAQEGR